VEPSLPPIPTSDFPGGTPEWHGVKPILPPIPTSGFPGGTPEWDADKFNQGLMKTHYYSEALAMDDYDLCRHHEVYRTYIHVKHWKDEETRSKKAKIKREMYAKVQKERSDAKKGNRQTESI